MSTFKIAIEAVLMLEFEGTEEEADALGDFVSEDLMDGGLEVSVSTPNGPMTAEIATTECAVRVWKD